MLGPIADGVFETGLHVVGFSYPVVPLGKARIRTQVSAAHSEDDLRFAAATLAEVAAAHRSDPRPRAVETTRRRSSNG